MCARKYGSVRSLPSHNVEVDTVIGGKNTHMSRNYILNCQNTRRLWTCACWDAYLDHQRIRRVRISWNRKPSDYSKRFLLNLHKTLKDTIPWHVVQHNSHHGATPFFAPFTSFKMLIQNLNGFVIFRMCQFCDTSPPETQQFLHWQSNVMTVRIDELWDKQVVHLSPNSTLIRFNIKPT